VNAISGVVADSCTPASCPSMTMPNAVDVIWVDEKGKKCKYSAPQYIDCALSTLERLALTEEGFPTKYGI
jgi:MOB kinase activator 1